MAILPTLLSSSNPQIFCSQKTITPKSCNPNNTHHHTKITTRKILICSKFHNKKAIGALIGAGFALTLTTVPLFVGVSSSAAATELPLLLVEPSNALSLPTWAIHVSSVVEWVTAMVLVWQYGEASGYESWKGLSWGMVPLLGGAFCACTWHFFYNAESLEVLVALQGALTVIGNVTMCIAAYRIYKSSQERST